MSPSKQKLQVREQAHQRPQDRFSIALPRHPVMPVSAHLDRYVYQILSTSNLADKAVFHYRPVNQSPRARSPFTCFGMHWPECLRISCCGCEWGALPCCCWRSGLQWYRRRFGCSAVGTWRVSVYCLQLWCRLHLTAEL